jgi:tetratricopeptide (TPR) repeat protein
VAALVREATGNRAVTPQQISALIQNGLAFHQQGRPAEAEGLYRQVLRADPNHPDALHLLGLIAHHAGKLDDALPLIRRAAQRRPADPNIQHNLGVVLRDSGDAKRAIPHFRNAIAAAPGFAEAHNNLGVALRGLGRHDEALACFEKAVSLKPEFCEALANVGAELSDRRRYDEAYASMERALRINPDYVPALSNIGAVLNSLSRPEEGARNLERAIALQPEFIEAHFNYGVVLRTMDRFDESEREYRFVLDRQPGFARAHANLGVLYRSQGRVDLARASFEQAKRLDAKLGEPYLGLAGLEVSYGDPMLGISLFEEARKLKPGDPETLYMRTLGFLRVADFKAGWADYGYRGEIVETGMKKARRPFTQPVWDGRPLEGKRLLVWGEQGIGDELWAAGMYIELMRRVGPGNHIVLEGPEKLQRLFERSLAGKVEGVNLEFVAQTDPPDIKCIEGIDYQIAGGSLGSYLRPSLESFPKREATGGAYLFADGGREAHWREKFTERGPALKVGISWRSSNLRGERALSCTRLTQWGDILRLPGVQFVNLQYDECETELKDAESAFGVTITRFPEVDMYDDLDETAALMRGLDLVISAPTSVSILSAALGVPTWQMNHGAEWQLHGQANNPWYPAMKNYARRWDQPWEDILKQIAGELEAMAVQVRNVTGVAA